MYVSIHRTLHLRASLCSSLVVTLLRRSPLSVMLWQDVKLAPQRVGYVAHYDLFAAAPLLRRDITVPPCVPLFSQQFIVTSSRYVGSASSASLPLGRAQLAAAAQSDARRKLRHYHSILCTGTPAACELHGCWDAGAACPSSVTSDSPAAAAERVFAWFGPSGTYSPLHHDPWHNLLVQVVGRKRVRCYAPCSTPALYPFPSSHAHGTRTACSTVTDHDAACPAKYPLFAAAPSLEAELHPGDALFIPRLHWHAARALARSFSVNFWW